MLEPCPGCAARFTPTGGAVHPYIGASAGCWALHSTILIGAAPDPGSLADSAVEAVTPVAATVWPGAGALLLDAYAAQHHGDPSRKAIQSVAVHLLVLHGVLGRGIAPDRALWLRQRALRTRGVFSWLAPPPRECAWTLRHLFPGGGVTRPVTAEAYVSSVYAAWVRDHRATLDAWFAAYVLAEVVPAAP